MSPEYRRRGLGTLLLRRVAAIAVERGCGRFEWTVLDWNTDAHRFYEDLGAEMLPEWRIFRIHGYALRQLAKTRTYLRTRWCRNHLRSWLNLSLGAK